MIDRVHRIWDWSNLAVDSVPIFLQTACSWVRIRHITPAALRLVKIGVKVHTTSTKVSYLLDLASNCDPQRGDTENHLNEI
jgi:hypothetical protein